MTGINRVALISGCGKEDGIGSETARILARRGVRVVVADRTVSGVANATDDKKFSEWRGLPDLVDEITREGGEASSIMGSVSDEEEVNKMVNDVVARYGRLDILVNNAAAPQGAEFGDIQEVPTEAWDFVLSINLRGTFFMTRAAVKAMRANGWGRVVNVSSMAGRAAVGRQAAYSASKAGIIGMTRSVAHDVGKDGITVNAVCPGWIRTSRSFNSARRVSNDVEAEFDRRAQQVPVGRLGTAHDVAATIAFLASDDASYITGQAIEIDGGLVTT